MKLRLSMNRSAEHRLGPFQKISSSRAGARRSFARFIVPRPEAALTLVEVLVVIIVGGILVVLILPVFYSGQRARMKAPKINCMNNLKQVAIAYRIWEGDNGDRFPMGVSITNGGSMEMVVAGNVVQTFMVMSNELSTPKILICPAETNRAWVMNFEGLSNSNVSYFIGVDATNDTNPQQILSGDCNFEIVGKPVKPGLLRLWTNDPVAWSAARHVHSGNLGLADGSVQTSTSISTSTISLHGFLVQTGVVTNRLAIP